MIQLVVGQQLVVDVDKGKCDADAALLKDIEEAMLVEAVAFTCEAAHAVTVDCVVKLAFGCHDKHLTRHVESGLYSPLDTERKCHEAASLGIETLNQFATAQVFGFWKAGIHLTSLALVALAATFFSTVSFLGFVAVSLRSFSAARWARRAAAWAFFSSMRCL